MMQIDCEILDTQLIHIRKSLFPQAPSEAFRPPYTNHTADSPGQQYHSNQTAGTNPSDRPAPQGGEGLQPRSPASTLSRQHKQRLKRHR